MGVVVDGRRRLLLSAARLWPEAATTDKHGPQAWPCPPDSTTGRRRFWGVPALRWTCEPQADEISPFGFGLLPGDRRTCGSMRTPSVAGLSSGQFSPASGLSVVALTSDGVTVRSLMN